MSAAEFSTFRLVGGTSLGLQRGHRISVDIDLFTDAPYRSIDFNAIDQFLRSNYTYLDTSVQEIGIGKSYFIGDNKDESVKLDIFYTDNFIRPIKEIDSIRLATLEEIIAMKIEVISRGGRKKDFWDIHELMGDFSLDEMLDLHLERYPFGHERTQIIDNITAFESADLDFDPVCLRHKPWELIKLDILDFSTKARK